MKAWVFVEGESDRLALVALWRDWIEELGSKGWGVKIIPLKNKGEFLKKIGPRAAEKLAQSPDDLAVGLPDLYPNTPYKGTRYWHQDYQQLQEVQRGLVREGLNTVFKIADVQSYMERFHAGVLKYDLEMLLLAAKIQLRERLRTAEGIGNWRHPVEDQNQNRPPKRIVEELFSTRLKRAYRDTQDGPAVLRNASINHVIFDEHRRAQCPVFRGAVDWIGLKTGVRGY